MRRFAVSALCGLALALGACSTARTAHVTPETAPSGPPKLIVAISVDQFSADLFAQYRSRFSSGLARLQQGAVFPSGFQAHAATETCPGHATLLTGTRPARSGIIANNWYDLGTARAEKKIYCAEDENDPASSSRDPVVSAVHLKVPTLGDLMKGANPATRNVSVSAKDRAVMMMGGHRIDAAYWYYKGQFATLKGREPSPAANAINNAVAALVKKGAPAMPMPAWCASADQPIAVGKGQLGTGRFALEAGKPDALRASPRMDSATVDLANALIDEMNLGKGSVADILSVSLSATDYIGHANGTEGGEMCVQMAELDRTIGRLLAHLDARGIDYAVVLSADHGGLDIPERQREQALPRAVRADPGLAPQALAKALSVQTGVTSPDPLLSSDGLFGDFYVSRKIGAADRARVIGALVKLARAHPQVAAVFTADELAKTPLPSGSPQDFTLKDRARASFDPTRSGDVVILLDRAVTPIPEPAVGSFVATHGSAWDYDRRVPMLFWRKGLRGFEQPAPVETIDIAPTLAAMLGLAVPEGTFDGRCLDVDGGERNTCEVIK